MTKGGNSPSPPPFRDTILYLGHVFREPRNKTIIDYSKGEEWTWNHTSVPIVVAAMN